MVLPARTTQWPPIQASCSIVIGAAVQMTFRRSSGSMECPAAKNEELGPTMTLSPKLTGAISRMVMPRLKVTSSPTVILLPYWTSRGRKIIIRSPSDPKRSCSASRFSSHWVGRSWFSKWHFSAPAIIPLTSDGSSIGRKGRPARI